MLKHSSVPNQCFSVGTQSIFAGKRTLAVGSPFLQSAIKLISPSLRFSLQEYWRGFLTLGGLPDPGIKPVSPAFPALQADSLLLSYWGSH